MGGGAAVAENSMLVEDRSADDFAEVLAPCELNAFDDVSKSEAVAESLETTLGGIVEVTTSELVASKDERPMLDTDGAMIEVSDGETEDKEAEAKSLDEAMALPEEVEEIVCWL